LLETRPPRYFSSVRPPPLPAQIELLEGVLARTAELASAGAIPIVVFDLDGTLFDNRPRTRAILLDYAADVANEYPEVAERLTPLEIEGIGYLLSTTLRDCGLTHADVVRDITHFWRDRFFSDDYLEHDLAIAGAPDYVNACYESGAAIVYLTGRDIPEMLPGTVQALRDHGFPIAKAGVELVLKPDATLPDDAFKRTALPTLHRVGEVIAVFDNEPAVCNAALEEFPEATIALLETQKVPGAPEPRPGLLHATDFRIR
jgi:hypothetical protein